MKRLYKYIFQKRNEEKSIKVFWSSNKYIAGKDWENFGDALVPWLVKKISGKGVEWNSKKTLKKTKIFFVIGSILEQAHKNCIVWGAGVINSHSRIKPSNFLAVRGPISYSRVLASGEKMEPIWGDPALLCPMVYPAPKKKQRDIITIIPHYMDYGDVKKKFKDQKGYEILDLKVTDVELIIDKIATSKIVFSSSLHGLIVAHAYGIKAIWVQFSERLDGDDIKFNDYFMSVGIRLYKPFDFTEDLMSRSFSNDRSLPHLPTLQKVQMNLIRTCPFFNL
ncbi:Polysaccharide pyruvyl transferase [Salinimicrobium catena]|uniref:Polysaccharide pyruvyl transferase n=1 Tax=Salinimicrobium catena TaxID=390640 RepID=A0A1H5NB20_9FLAO|nr:polysaccharide pyruvyl transferase family protein [Salinimicrobium catena]SDL41648.1 Polysaccharide pyruvyl transferase [Salinimicrobium catena]SEE98773.1 Polysaccharide pyruvyl transferase [Salinimicrobium catena]